MRSSVWKASRNVEKAYLKALTKLVKMFSKLAATSKELYEYEEKMRKFQNSTSYNKYIYSIVRRMVLPLSNINEDTWRKAARKATRSKFFYYTLVKNINSGLDASMQDQINRNATIIQTLPSDVSKKVVNDIGKYTIQGLRAIEISKLIKDKTDQHARASAKLIARTEVSKTQTALTRARAENIEKRWYVWRTEEDARVRDSHRTMDDVIVNWQDPPSPEILTGLKPANGNAYYHAGEIYNCRCYPEVLLEVDDVKWPHKVYQSGRIVTMNRKEFEKIF